MNGASFNRHPTFPLATPLTAQHNLRLPPQVVSPSPFGHQGVPNRTRHGQNASIAQMPLGMMGPPSAGPRTPGFSTMSPAHQRQSSAAPGSGMFMKSRRTASVSIGGPPKALLGGPQRKLSPLPGVTQASAVQTPPLSDAKFVTKKVNVRMPAENARMEGDDDESRQLSLWIRQPVRQEPPLPSDPGLHLYPHSQEVFPPFDHCRFMPPTFEVFLPNQV